MSGHIAILGGGRLAQAITSLLGAKGVSLRLWARRPAARNALAKKFTALDSLQVVETLEEAAEGAAMLVVAVPAGAFRALVSQLGAYATPDQILLHATRGVEAGFVLPQQIVREETCLRQLGVLGGPLHFEELKAGRRIAAVLATRFDRSFAAVRGWVGSEQVHLHRSRDLVGVEVAGIIANVSAIAVGASDALELGDTARGILLTRGLLEGATLGKALGAKGSTFAGLAGVGELIPRKVSSTRRHHLLGAALASGEPPPPKPAKREIEGIVAAREATQLALRLGLSLPMIQAVDMLLNGDADPTATLEEILALDLPLQAMAGR